MRQEYNQTEQAKQGRSKILSCFYYIGDSFGFLRGWTFWYRLCYTV